jgi:subtilase family serine protease
MRRSSLLASLGAIALASAAAPTAGTAAVVAAVHPFAQRAPESAFTAAAPGVLGTACHRPAPDNRVSTTVHCYGPDQLRSFYGLGALAGSNDGAGQTIVLVDSYGSPTAVQDVQFFAQTFGGPAPDVEQVFPQGKIDYKSPTGNGSGQSGPTSADGWAGEANLDVQWAYAMAPKAHIVLVAVNPAETLGVQGLPNMMKAIDWAIATYPAGSVFSMSFGTSEEAFAGSSAAQQFARFDQTFKRGLAKHDTFLASSGDDGSSGVSRAHRQTADAGHESVSYPNVSPYVTSVGGTQVQDGWTWDPQVDKPFNDDGSRNVAYWNWTAGGSSEAVWNEGWGPIGTGGGLSRVYGRPSYQDSVADVVGTHRGVPDLAWNAAVNGGALTYIGYYPSIEGPPRWGVFGGTSAASPQAAGLTAIANQARAAAHKGPVGNLNARIYSASFDRSAAFNDIVPRTYGITPSGHLDSNAMWAYTADGFLTPGPLHNYPTTTGYDLTTGWGSPNAPGYVAQLLAQP